MNNRTVQFEQDNSKYKMLAVSSLVMGILSWLFCLIVITFFYFGIEIDRALGKILGSLAFDLVPYAALLAFPLALVGTIFGFKSVNKAMERIASTGIVLGIIGIMPGVYWWFLIVIASRMALYD